MTQTDAVDAKPEFLGDITCHSGTLLILDGGCAWMWSHDRAPLLPENPNVVGATEDARDLVICGPDALTAGRLFARSINPLFVCDQPSANVEEFQLAFAEMTQTKGLSAKLEVLPERVPPRKRIDLLLRVDSLGGCVEFHGLSAAVIAGVPSDQSLPVVGERIPSGPDEGRWKRVWIDIRPGQVARQQAIGKVWVDEARLMMIDVETLAHWDDRNSQDGKADLIFWGRDAEAVAEELKANPIESSSSAALFGWTDLLLDEGVVRIPEILALRSNERRFALDFRPHTHHWDVMRTVRYTKTESGVLDLAGTRLAMFMTTWGDGEFPIEVDCNEAGEILRLRVELGCDEIVARQRELDERWFRPRT